MHILCLDSEGTIRNKGKVIPNLGELLTEFNNYNVVSVIATGLPKHVLDSRYENVYKFPYQIYSNGSYVYDALNDKTVYYSVINNEILHKIISLKDEFMFNLKVTVYGEEYCTDPSVKDEHVKIISFEELKEIKNICQIYVMTNLSLTFNEKKKFVNNYVPNSISKKDYNTYLKVRNDINELYSFISYLELKKIKEIISSYEGIRISNDSPNFYKYNSKNEKTWFSINNDHVTKYNALLELSKYLNVDINNVMAVGDDSNDIDMISKTNFAVSIINHKKKLCINNGVVIEQRNLEFLLYYLLSYLYTNKGVLEFKKDAVNVDFNIPLIARLSDSNLLMVHTRCASRGILFDYDNSVVLFNKQRIGEIKLPGGGMESFENPNETFTREVKEETGCTIKNIRMIGYTIERKEKNNFKQVSFVYEAFIENEGLESAMTEEELFNLGKKVNYTFDEALVVFKDAKHNLVNLEPIDFYHESFIVNRDYKILKFAKNRD